MATSIIFKSQPVTFEKRTTTVPRRRDLHSTSTVPHHRRNVARRDGGYFFEKLRRIGKAAELNSLERRERRNAQVKRFVKQLDRDARKNAERSLARTLVTLADGYDGLRDLFPEESELLDESGTNIQDFWRESSHEYDDEVVYLRKLFSEHEEEEERKKRGGRAYDEPWKHSQDKKGSRQVWEDVKSEGDHILEEKDRIQEHREQQEKKADEYVEKEKERRRNERKRAEQHLDEEEDRIQEQKKDEKKKEKRSKEDKEEWNDGAYM